MRDRPMPWMLALIGSVIAIVALAVLALTAARNPSSTAVADLALGDCFDLPVADSDAPPQTVEIVERVDIIDCDEPHRAEVVLVGELNAGGDLDYPSDAELFEQVDRRCVSASGLIDDRFGLLPIAPTSNSWDLLGGRFHCLAVPFGGDPTTGTLVESGLSG